MSRKLIFVDPNFSVSSPSMSAIVKATPDLLKAGFEIEAWCWKHDPVAGVSIRILPSVPIPAVLMRWLFIFSGWVFFFVAHFHWVLWRLKRQNRDGDILVSTGFYLLCANAALIHFSHFDWLKAQFRIGFYNLRSCLELAFTLVFRIPSELLLLWNPCPTLLVSVSRSVSEDMKRWGAPWKKHTVLPNPYEPEKFNEQVRCRYREEARRELGIGSEELIFIFASMAQYHRKGFWLAAKAIFTLRPLYPEVHFLVIGGFPRNVEMLKKEATRLFGDWSSWLHFTGLTKEMPKYLSAGDALIFPSYSEAFALVEIESAAMGLRLYLTPHHGSEMILIDGQNGRKIPWSVEGIAEVLGEDLDAGIVKPGAASHGEAPAQSEYAARLLEALGVVVP